MTDAVVVGSGPNGLAAAITLAAAGREVLVLEAADRPGGGARSAELTEPGYVHDVCSAVHPLGVASPFFASLPLEHHGLTWLHPDVLTAHPLPGGGAGVLLRSLEETGTASGDPGGWRRLLGPIVDRWDSLIGEILGPVLHRPRHPLSLVRFGLSAIVPASLLARRLDDARAQALLTGITAHLAARLDRPLSAAPGLVLAAAGHVHGWPVAQGGSQAITDALVAHLRALGGEVECGAHVRRWDDLPPAAAVLLDTSVDQALAIAGDRVKPGVRRRLRRFAPGPGSFKLDYALSEPVPWAEEACRRAGTVHLGGTAEEVMAAEHQVASGRVPERPFVIAAQQSLVDPSRAPAGRHTFWAYCHVPNGSTVDMTTAVEDQIERYAPGFRDIVIARHVTDPAGLQRYNPSYRGGDIGGGSSSGLQLLRRPTLSPDPYRLGEAVWLCSASTPPGGGVHGMCGNHAARSALRGR